jgi:5-methylcytosine-specific restriction endonuclease McrA
MLLSDGESMDLSVLVLNHNYEPLNVCNTRRALVLVLCGKAEVLEHNHHTIVTATASFRVPSVIRLGRLVRRPLPQAKLSRREIFRRDTFSCQYCGDKARDLTLDHVMPRHRGGTHSWENLVSACRDCNHRKGGRTPEEARMKLRAVPRRPYVGPYYAVERRLRDGGYAEWRKFLPASLAED